MSLLIGGEGMRGFFQEGANIYWSIGEADSERVVQYLYGFPPLSGFEYSRISLSVGTNEKILKVANHVRFTVR